MRWDTNATDMSLCSSNQFVPKHKRLENPVSYVYPAMNESEASLIVSAMYEGIS